MTIQFPAPSETFASNEIGYLARHGHQVAVHCLRFRHPDHTAMVRERALDGVRVTHNELSANLRGLLRALSSPRLLARTASWVWASRSANSRDRLLGLLLLPRAFDVLARIEDERPDLVHLYWGHFPAIVGRLVQESMPETATSIGLGAYDLARRFGCSVEVARRADLVKTQARVNVEAIARFTGVRAADVKVVYNGIDVAHIVRLRETVAKVPGRVISVGRLVEGKGMDDVLRVFAEVKRSAPHATLTILGDGPLRQALERLAAELGVAGSVGFAGHVPQDDVIRAMAAAQCMLFLSKSERLPNVVKEAMACGCVCVTAATPGIEELVLDSRTGYLVQQGDLRRSAELVREILTAETASDAIAAAAFDHVVEHFSLEKTVPRLAALWQQALARRAARGPVDTGRSAPLASPPSVTPLEVPRPR